MTDVDEKQVNDVLQKIINKSEAFKITVGSLIDDEVNNMLQLVQTMWKKIQEDTEQMASLQRQVSQYNKDNKDNNDNKDIKD